MPRTSRGQLELDELLSDLYKGIETLPDTSSARASHNSPASASYWKSSSSNSNKSPPVYSSSQHLKEYQLPGSSAVVRQHKQELAQLRSAVNQQQQRSSPSYSSATSPIRRSTLKRHTNTPDQDGATSLRQPPQSLASFVSSNTNSTTPENKRRVRIVDHPDKLAKRYSNSAERAIDDSDNSNQLRGQSNVKYINTNKFIYHQERNPDDEDSNQYQVNSNSNDDYNNNADQPSDANWNEQNAMNANANSYQQEDDDDIDGVTRVEYYHTTWLDRQLGRASKRRSSKELNERQVKEKAMIEELKRSLKNGAITLRQSLTGKRNSGNKTTLTTHNRSSRETYDDQILNQNYSTGNSRTKESRVFGSGLATIPRNYHYKQSSSHKEQPMISPQPVAGSQFDTVYVKDDSDIDSGVAPKQTNTASSFVPSSLQATVVNPSKQQPDLRSNYSKTLPRNYQPTSTDNQQHHQLLQSHYRHNSNTLNSTDNMRNVHFNDKVHTNQHHSSATMNPDNNNLSGAPRSLATATKYNTYSPAKHQQQLGETISSIPSATEVVRSALSRSGSQISLNQLNKTINMIPSSPSPYAHSPMSPTQQLRAATPSLSPSPVGSPDNHHDSLYRPKGGNQQALHGTRLIPASPQQPKSNLQQPQPVYANPHASLMQHRQEQQKPTRNQASIREFNELDSLLRSLSPNSTNNSNTTHIAPGYTSRPAQPSYGLGFASAAAAPTATSNPTSNTAQIYAKVQKAQPSSKLGGHYGANISNNFIIDSNTSNQPFNVDVSNPKDENCLNRQELSEFEPPVDLLLPSMEDYQNITKLNPVKNHYWYKPSMSRDKAINLLRNKPQGTFIVRDSTSFRGAFGLAVKVAKLPKNVLNNASLRNPNADPSSELIRHFLIEPTSNGVQVKGYANEPVFSSLPDLIYQHSLTELALPCRLVIPRADIEDPNFNQKQKQFYDDFIASKELAKHSPYNRTSPNGGYRKYPGDVYVHNEHRIIFE